METKPVVSESEKILKAMIEASVMVNPSLENKLTVAAAWQYLQLPDSTFGWNAVDREKGVAQPMPIQFKVACLIPTIVNGLLPGHVIWMGNKPYATSGAFSHVVNRDVVKLSGIKYRPFTAEEKEMFCIGEKDMAVVAEQRVRIRDVELDWAGYGVLGADEMQANKWGNYKVATQLVRDKMQFVRTRAIRDMHSRNYPISGLSEADEVSFVEDVSPAAPVQTVATIEAPKAEPIRDLHAAITRFESLCQRVMSAGGEPLVILGVDKVGLMQDAGKLDSASDVLEDWLAEELLKPKAWAEPKPEPAPEAASESPAPAPKKRGRKSKAELEAIAAAEAAELEAKEKAKAAEESQPAGPGISIVSQEDVTIEESDLVPADDEHQLPGESEYDESEDLFENSETEDLPDPFAGPEEEIYSATDRQKEILRAAAAEVGFTGNGVLHALSGAMKDRPMSELPLKLEAIKKLHQPKPAETKQVDLKPLQDARERLKAAVEYVTKTGGAPMHILGVNPHNLLAGGTVEAMNNAAEKLEEWQPKAPAAIALPTKLEVPSQGPGLTAYKLLNTAYHSPQANEATKAKIAELAKRKLRDGDSVMLPKAIRLANEGKFDEIDEFLAAREMRA